MDRKRSDGLKWLEQTDWDETKEKGEREGERLKTTKVHDPQQPGARFSRAARSVSPFSPKKAPAKIRWAQTTF